MDNIRQETAGTRNGQAMLMFALGVLPALVVVLALAVDVGHIASARNKLQNGADAAALAGAQVLVWSQVDGYDEPTARSRAAAAADRLHQDNCPGAALALEFGIIDPNGNFIAVDTSQRATAVQAEVARTADCPDGRLDLFFAGIMGMHDTTVSGDAIASLFANVQGAKGVMPFAVPESRIGPPGTEITFYPESDIPPGCFGLLNLDGGSTSTKELKSWIEQGGCEVMLTTDSEGVWVHATTGLRNAIEKPMKDLVGSPVVMIIYDESRLSGSNTEFRITGFLAATLTSVKLTGASDKSSLTCRIEGVTSIYDLGAELYLGPGGHPSPNLIKVALWQ
jgi:hypothetical protein